MNCIISLRHYVPLNKDNISKMNVSPITFLMIYNEESELPQDKMHINNK